MNDPFRLSQTLVLPRELAFGTLRRQLEELGFAAVSQGVQARPLINGEPEGYGWTWPGGVPQIVYTFNPVARLRLLDVAEAPPQLRAVIAEVLDPLARGELGRMLQSQDDRDRLFALWAARETERLDLIHDIGLVMQSARGSLRDEAELVLNRLGDVAQARLDAMAGARKVAEAALDVLAPLADPDAVTDRLIRPEHCAALFVPEIADRLAEVIAKQRWPRRAVTAQPRFVEDVHAAPAGMFRFPNEVIDQFPMGYRSMAGWMRPERVWVAWKGVEPDGGGPMRMDALAFTGTEWVFFPKPFRLVLPLLPAFPETSDQRTG